MNSYEVTIRVSGSVTVTVGALSEAEARETAQEAWDPADIDDFDATVEDVECVDRPSEVAELGDTDKERLIAEVAFNTARQFRGLSAAGIKRTLYAVPDEVEDDETVDRIVASDLRGLAHFTREGSHTYLEAVPS